MKVAKFLMAGNGDTAEIMIVEKWFKLQYVIPVMLCTAGAVNKTMFILRGQGSSVACITPCPCFARAD